MTASLLTHAGFLERLQQDLEPTITAAGFVPSDTESGVRERDRDGSHLLEYRASIRGRTMFLDFAVLYDERVITAGLWAPERLRQAPSLSVTAVADRHLTWMRNEGSDCEALVASIVTEVSTWLGEI
jgi:hypothetical protein